MIVPAASALVVAVLYANPNPGQTVDRAAMQYVEADADRQEMEAVNKQLLTRIMYKEELIGQLIDGRLSLPEVAVEFVQLNEDTAVLEVIREQYPGASDEEKSAYNVLDFVRTRLNKKQDAEVLARLNREFEQKYGSVQGLDDVPPYRRPLTAQAQ